MNNFQNYIFDLVDLKILALKEKSTLLKTSELEPDDQMQFSGIPRRIPLAFFRKSGMNPLQEIQPKTKTTGQTYS